MNLYKPFIFDISDNQVIHLGTSLTNIIEEALKPQVEMDSFPLEGPSCLLLDSSSLIPPEISDQPRIGKVSVHIAKDPQIDLGLEDSLSTLNKNQIEITSSPEEEVFSTPVGTDPSTALMKEASEPEVAVQPSLPEEAGPSIVSEVQEVSRTLNRNEDPSAEGLIVSAPPKIFNQSSLPFDLPSFLERNGLSIIKTLDLEKIVEKILRDKLNQGMPLYGLAKRLEDTVERSYTNANLIREMDIDLNGRVEWLESAMSQHDSQLEEYSEDLSQSHHVYNEHREEIRKLRAELLEANSKIQTLESKLITLSESQSSEWKRHDLAHASLESRLTSWDEIKRLERLAGCTVDPALASNLKMEGIQLMTDFLIARGVFPRDLIHDPYFMDMIKDKDGLILKLNSDIIASWKQPWPGSSKNFQEDRAQRELSKDLGPPNRRNFQQR